MPDRHLCFQPADDDTTVLPQPAFLLRIVRKNRGNQRPEAGGVVHFLPVAELMHDDIIDDLRRRQHEETVEIKIPLRAAASPAGPLMADRDASTGDADALRVHRYPWRDVLRRLLAELPQLLVRQRGQCSGRCTRRPDPCHVGTDPVLAFRKYTIDFCVRRPVRHLEDDLGLTVHGQHDRPAPAPLDANGIVPVGCIALRQLTQR